MLVALRRMACSWAGVGTGDEEADVPAWAEMMVTQEEGCVRGSMSQG